MMDAEMRQAQDEAAATNAQMVGLFSHLLPSHQTPELQEIQQRLGKIAKTQRNSSETGSTVSSESSEVLLLLARLVLKHEHTLLARARSQAYVFFFVQNHDATFVPTFHKINQEWARLKEAGTAKMPLRMALLHPFLLELHARVTKLKQEYQQGAATMSAGSADAKARHTPLVTAALEHSILTPEGMFQERFWDPASRSHKSPPESNKISMAETLTLLDELKKLVCHPTVVERFASNAPLARQQGQKNLKSPDILTMQLVIGAGSQEGQRTHTLIQNLLHMSVFAMMGCSIRRDYGRLGTPAESLQKYVRSQLQGMDDQ